MCSAKHGSACCAPARGAAPTDGREAAASAAPRSRSAKGLVRIPGGTFLMGSEDGYPADREGPVREARVDSFYLDPHAVTNTRFAAFAKATGYRSDAERFGWSFVFHSFLTPAAARASGSVVSSTPWWVRVEGASWRAPEGPGSSIAARQDHPVVHVSWNDARAYCAWADRRLPTEVEWERAARGGIEGKRYPWGDELTPRGRHRCNIWQGTFPDVNTGEDGHLGTAPVSAFPPNAYGLYNMSGNVWEWCADAFSPDTRVIRGGSYLCHESYCNRYRVAARSGNTPDSTTGNMGFRCALDATSTAPAED